jgi:hypothetical protein
MLYYHSLFAHEFIHHEQSVADGLPDIVLTQYGGVRVYWPDSPTDEWQEFPGGPGDRTVVLRRGEGHAP